MKIPFNKPALVGNEIAYIAKAVADGRIAGGGPFTKQCENWLERRLSAKRVLMTHSGSGALEMAAILSGVGPGDEVIMPSFTFSSTANAFVLRGATPVFVDIRPDTLNIDEALIETAVTPQTKVVVPVHYASVACDMGAITRTAHRHGLTVIEDAAQAHFSFHDGHALGTIGSMGCLSFHETKNITSGDGGALIVNDDRLQSRAEIVRDKGTDRGQFVGGAIDKYTWQDLGSSFYPAEFASAFLLAQLEHADAINEHRRSLYERYLRRLTPLLATGRISSPNARRAETNGHMFWLLLANPQTQKDLIAHLARNDIAAVSHYTPLHSSRAGLTYGRVAGAMPVTESISGRLIRLPMFYDLTFENVDFICGVIFEFFGVPFESSAQGSP